MPETPPGGWTAADPDRLDLGECDALAQVELVDGALIVREPRTEFRRRVVDGLLAELRRQAPAGLTATREMDLVLGPRLRLCPEVSVVTATAARDLGRTCYRPADVLLVAEIGPRPPESRPRHYAETGIPHFWRIENNASEPVVHTYELDPATRAYALTGIFHDRLQRPVPFPVDIALAGLVG